VASGRAPRRSPGSDRRHLRAWLAIGHPQRLRRQAVHLQRRLENKLPGRRITVSYWMPEQHARQEKHAVQAEEKPGFFSHRDQGVLIVMPTVGDAQPNAVVLPGTERELRDPDFIRGAKALTSLVQATGFRDKVRLLETQLQRITKHRGVDDEESRQALALGEMLVDSLLVDLWFEQATILRAGWKSPISGSLVKNNLNQLAYLTEYRFPRILADESRSECRLAVRLIAGICFLARHQRRWFEHWLFPWSLGRRAPALRRQTLRRCDALTWTFFEQQERRSVRRLIDEAYADYRRRLRNVPPGKRPNVREAARHVLQSPLARHRIFTDVQGLLRRVFDYDEWRTLHHGEQQRDVVRAELLRQRAQRRTEFLVAHDGKVVQDQESNLRRAAETFAAACAR